MISFFFKQFFKNTINQKRSIAYHKMSNNSVQGTVVNRSCVKIGFHDSKTVLYFVAVHADFKNRFCVIIKIGCYGIKAIVFFFLLNCFFVKNVGIETVLFSFGLRDSFDESGNIMRPLFVSFRIDIFKQLFRSFNLPVAYVTLIFHHFS